MVRHASVLLAGVGMMLLGEATGNPLYDVLLQGGGMTLLAVVVVILLLKVLPGYHQAMKDVAETHAKALAEFRIRSMVVKEVSHETIAAMDGGVDSGGE